LLSEMRSIKGNVDTRTTRSTRNTLPSRYADGERAGGRGRGRGRRGGGGGGGVDLEPPPSASGTVAPQLFLEGGPSRDEAETETESRDEQVHPLFEIYCFRDFLSCIAKC
jgi:hypothetical protein